jgi:hypothetical protein
MVKRVEVNNLTGLFYKCCMSKCGQTFASKQSLRRHLAKSHATQIEKISCLFCAKLFNCITNRQISDFFDHLKIDHSELVKESLLLVDPCGEQRGEQEVEDALDWPSYFGTANDETVDEVSPDPAVCNEDTRDSETVAAAVTTAAVANNNDENENDDNNANNSDDEFDDSRPKSFACGLCKRTFGARGDLSKHQCIEQLLKLMRKRKEIRKKKWREAHWKRKIDLSYIESTSLTHVAKNIADNLAYCVDGTLEDLRAYAREVKDYMNSELGGESELDMLIKCGGLNGGGLGELANVANLETVVRSKANNYFVNNSNSNDTRLVFLLDYLKIRMKCFLMGLGKQRTKKMKKKPIFFHYEKQILV